MKTLPKFDETEITIADGVITVKQTANYRSESIRIPVALWDTFVDAVIAEIYPEELAPAYPDTVQP